MIADIKKFSFGEMTSNSDGKTSGSGTAGVYLVFIGGLVIIMGSITGLFMNAPQASNVLLAGTGAFTFGAGLLGYRKSVDKTSLDNGIDPSAKTEDTPKV
jgi:hypothetical protein